MAELEQLKERVSDLVGKKPEKAASILTLWLKEGVQALKKSKAG